MAFWFHKRHWMKHLDFFELLVGIQGVNSVLPIDTKLEMKFVGTLLISNDPSTCTGCRQDPFAGLLQLLGSPVNRAYLAACFKWSKMLYIYTMLGGAPMANDYRNSPEGAFAQGMEGSVATQSSLHGERHYAVAEIAELWNLSVDKVRELFADEPGVLVIGRQRPFRRRPYLTLRIPQSVAQRVHARLSGGERFR